VIDPETVARAVRVLRSGGLVAFPTETVYGLGADASQPDAVARIFEVKGRPASRPLTVHLAPSADPAAWGSFDERAARLARSFWPGPLTLVVPAVSSVPDLVTAGGETVGLRVPDHPHAIALLTAFGGGVAAPSANRSGHLSPTEAHHVRDDLGQDVDFILDGGACPGGMESTVVSLAGVPRVLRPGAIATTSLSRVLGESLRSAPVASVKLRLDVPLRLLSEGELRELAPNLDVSSTVVVRGDPGWASSLRCAVIRLPADAEGYARRLYPTLRELRADRVWICSPPDTEMWEAIRDRLDRLAR